MTDTKEPHTLNELHEVASRLDKAIGTEDLTVEEARIVLMMMRESAAANLAARAVMKKISMDMEKVSKLVESGKVSVVKLEPKPPTKNVRIVPNDRSNN